MPESGPAWYMPMCWPFSNINYALSVSNEDKPKKGVGTPTLDLLGHVLSCVASLRSFILSLLCIYVFSTDYPAFGAASTWKFEWMWPILLRNLLAAWLICGFWDWFLYFSPLKNKLQKYKINQKYPSITQFKHDLFWTTTAMFTGTLLEIYICRYYASGAAGRVREVSWSAFKMEMLSAPLWNLTWILFITHWRVPHFYVIHRLMHPWKTKNKNIDLGQFFGTSMHPLESSLYFSAALIAVPFGVHPSIPLACLIDCGVGAWLGHDGFQWPGSGDLFHQLHHAHFDCNYGAMHVPIDYLFGTFVSEKEDLRRIWGKKTK